MAELKNVRSSCGGIDISKFFPAFAHTDSIGYFDRSMNRKVMSIRGFIPEEMSSRFLTSLSFDESIHYEFGTGYGDFESPVKASLLPPKEVFVDCGAFHYKNLEVPRFKTGGFAGAITAFENYQKRHLSREVGANYLLCSPDHIIPPGADDELAEKRVKFTISNARQFIDLVDGEKSVTPVGVVHGRSLEERKKMTEELIDIGYEYLAFGGLVPLARNPRDVLWQLAGCPSYSDDEIAIQSDSPLGIAKEKGVKTHLFGLNSPDWYRWSKRLGIDSFDGSKLSTEGAVNGIIWIEEEFSLDNVPVDAKKLYRRLQVKKISTRDVNTIGDRNKFNFSSDGKLEFKNPGWEYLQSARCTSPKCPHGPEIHHPDPRVTGSIEHNMGRTILNAWTFKSLMEKIDSICEFAEVSDDESVRNNWGSLEVI